MSMQKKVNILMVDDQPGKLLTYEAILSELGENLIKASSGREALEHLLKTNVAVVLMDVSMPELDGFELADIIRQHPRFQETTIIFISAVHLTDLDRVKGYQRGAVDYISVPVVPELLRAKVSVFAELHRRAQQLEILNGQLRRLSTSLISTQDDERRRIARELHDGLGQDLIAAKIVLDVALGREQPVDGKEKAVVEASTLVDHAIQQVFAQLGIGNQKNQDTIPLFVGQRLDFSNDFVSAHHKTLSPPSGTSKLRIRKWRIAPKVLLPGRGLKKG